MATGNQVLLSGNYGEIRVNKRVVAGFKGWTLNYSVSLSQEGQFATGKPILVPGLYTVSVTISKLMLYGDSLVAVGIEPKNTLDDIVHIPPFRTELYETLNGGMVAAAIQCIFDSASINASANAAFINTVTIYGTDVVRQSY